MPEIRKIIEKANRHNATKEERKEFLALFHHNDLEYRLKVELFKDLQQSKSNHNANLEPLFERIWENIINSKKLTNPPLSSIGSWMKIAAILIIGVFIGNLIPNRTMEDPAQYYTSIAPEGAISEMIFPDNSIVYLNAGTEIRYSTGDFLSKREVYLNGEAWFKVEKNEGKLFTVHTNGYDVNVLGTEFNVKAYDSDKEVVTTLESGKVRISSSKNCKLKDDIILVPGEQIAFNKEEKSIAVKDVNTKWFTAWKDNKLIFVNMELKELIVLVERKYGVTIEVEDKEILKYHYDGTIKNETIIEFLNLLKQTLPIDYHIIGQKILIQKNNQKRR